MKWPQAKLLKELREAKGWSQKQLAEVAKLSQQAIGHWELGDREPAASNLFALCRALGVSCELFATAAGEVSEPTPAKPRGRPKNATSDEQPAEEPKAEKPDAKQKGKGK